MVFCSAKDIAVSAKDFRNMIGPDIIRSTNFSVKKNGRICSFQGSGWGHGVGMCQWGAYYMAKADYSFSDILEFYYPGCKISSIKQLSGDK